MRNRMLPAALASVALIALGVSLAFAAEGQKPAQGYDEEAMKQWMAEYGKLGPQHEMFKNLAGNWKTKATTYCQDPQNPQVSEGTAQFKLLLGGRFIEQHFHGSFDGQPFEGMGLTGYDNAQKKYVGVWLDSMGTGIMHTEGQFDEATKTMTETGEIEIPASPMGPTMKMKMVTKCEGDDKFLFTMYMLMPDGSENKTMEIVYTRQ